VKHFWGGRRLIPFVLLVFLLAACGSSGDESAFPTLTPFPTLAPSPEPDTAAPSDPDPSVADLEPGTFSATLSGERQGTVEAGTNIDYLPAVAPGDAYANTNGTGLRELQFRVPTDGESNNALFSILIGEGIEAGVDYTPQRLTDFDSDSDAAISPTMSSSGNFYAAPEDAGTVNFSFINRAYVSGTMTITLTDADGEEPVTLEATFREIPFEPHAAECLTSLSGALQMRQQVLRSNLSESDGVYTVPCSFGYSVPNAAMIPGSIVRLSGSAVFTVPADVEPGEYEISPDSSPVAVTVDDPIELRDRLQPEEGSNSPPLSDEAFTPSDVSGTVTMARDGDDLVGTFEVTFTIDRGEVTLPGEFRFPAPAEE